MMMKEDDEAKEILRRLMENLGEASGVLLDLRDYMEISERRARRVIKRMIRAAVILVAGYLIVLWLTTQAIDHAHDEAVAAQKAANDARNATERTEISIRRNRLAIKVGCTLLRRSILEADAERLTIPDCDYIAANPDAVLEDLTGK